MEPLTIFESQYGKKYRFNCIVLKKYETHVISFFKTLKKYSPCETFVKGLGLIYLHSSLKIDHYHYIKMN
jgi:hypothetical protein